MNTQLDPGLSKFSYESLALLTVFAKNRTFKKVSGVVGIPEFTVRKRLQDLASAVEDRTGTSILEAKNSRLWVLTEAGERLARQSEAILNSMESAMQSIEGGQLVNVVTTSNCCGYMAELKETVDHSTSSAHIRVRPLLRRSSEISFKTLPEDTEFALFSKLVDTTANTDIAVGVEVRVEGGWMIPLDIQEINLLSTRRLVGLPPPQPTPTDLLKAGMTLCIPDGGVAWDFVRADFPDWHRLHYRQHFGITDLYGGIKVLETGIAGPDAAMIVHGLEADDPRLVGLPSPFISSLYDDPGAKTWRAVTGFFRAERRDAAESHDRDWKNFVWEQALQLWTVGEKEVAS